MIRFWLFLGENLRRRLRSSWWRSNTCPRKKKGEKRPRCVRASGAGFFFCIRRSFDGGAFYSSQLVGSQHSQVRILQVMSMGQQLQPRWIGLALLIFGLASPSLQSSPDYHDELENTAVNTNDADVFGYYGPPSNYLENVSFLNMLHYSFLIWISLTHFDSIGLASLKN